MSLQDRVNKGLQGDYTGLANGLTKINKYIFGIQRACYYLLGGMSGTYKTTLCDFMLLNAIEDAEAKGIPCNVYYYSYEIDMLSKKCNWLSVLIYKKHNVIIAPEIIKGLGEFRLTPEEQKLVELEIPNLEELFTKIKFHFTPMNPTGIYNELWAEALTRGKLEHEEYVDEGVVGKRIIGYKSNIANGYNIVVLDHLYLLKKERGFDTKEVIDKWSEYCVHLRNLFGYTFINIQQFNDGLSSIDRLKFKGADLSPQMNDFRDSRNSYMDADVVLGTMCPYKMDLKRSLGYDIERLKSSMIMLKVIKNRLSKDNVGIGLYCNPKAGSFKELPDPEDINYNDYT